MPQAVDLCMLTSELHGSDFLKTCTKYQATNFSGISAAIWSSCKSLLQVTLFKEKQLCLWHTFIWSNSVSLRSIRNACWRKGKNTSFPHTLDVENTLRKIRHMSPSLYLTGSVLLFFPSQNRQKSDKLIYIVMQFQSLIKYHFLLLTSSSATLLSSSIWYVWILIKNMIYILLDKPDI